jgi:hypothetical protein
MVRAYAVALDLDADDLVELWWAMQGMVAVEDRTEERINQRWWRQLRASPKADEDYTWANIAAGKIRTPNEDFRAPSLQLFALAEEICGILRRLLGDSWKVDYKSELGLYEPVEGYPATITIELRAGKTEDDNSVELPELMVSFVCPEPVARPTLPDTRMRPKAETISSDIAWILSSIEAMSARERAAVAGFIHGLREGGSLFSEAFPAAPPAP